jgi:hypothetical protein
VATSKVQGKKVIGRRVVDDDEVWSLRDNTVRDKTVQVFSTFEKVGL